MEMFVPAQANRAMFVPAQANRTMFVPARANRASQQPWIEHWDENRLLF